MSTSKSTWKFVFSTPMERARLTTQLPSSPSRIPSSRPPTNSTRKSTPASTRENDPVTTAAMANWKDTIPEASFKSSSPFNMEAWRFGMSTCFESDETATASVGPKAAPRAKAAASGMEGTNAFSRKPMTSVVATTRPMAKESTGLRSRQSACLSACFASS